MVEVSTTPHCTGIWTRRPSAVLLLLIVLASVAPGLITSSELTPLTVASTVAPDAVVPAAREIVYVEEPSEKEPVEKPLVIKCELLEIEIEDPVVVVPSD